MRAIWLLLAATTLLAGTTSALYEDQAGLHDWHLPLLGRPLNALFHKGDTRATQLFVLTDRSTLASVNPRNGNLVRRHALVDGNATALRASGQRLATLNSDGGRRLLRAWDATSSFLLWERAVTASAGAHEGDIAFTPAGDLLLLADCSTLHLVSGMSGATIWTAALPTSESVCYDKIHASSASARVVGRDSKGVQVVRVDLKDGETVDTTPTVKCPKDTRVLLADNTDASLYAAWAVRKADNIVLHAKEAKEGAKLRSHSVQLEDKHAQYSLKTLTGDGSVLLLSVRSKAAATVRLFTLQDGDIVPYLQLDEKHSGAASVFTHVRADKGQLFVVRLFAVDATTASVQVYDLTKKKPVAEHTISHDFSQTGPFVQARAELALAKGGDVNAVRVLATTADGSVHMLRDKTVSWTREESLADAAFVEAIDLPENKLLSQDNDELDEPLQLSEHISSWSRFLRRVVTHVNQLSQLVRHFTGGDSDHAVTGKAGTHGDDILHRDTFGLRKLLVFATRSGKLLALDSAHRGKIVWSRYLGTRQESAPAVVTGLFPVRTTVVKFPPLLSVVLENALEGGAVSTTVHSIDALSGNDYSIHVADDSEASLSATVVYAPGMRKVYRLPLESSRDRLHLLAMLDTNDKIHVWPNTPETRQQVMAASSALAFTNGAAVGSRTLAGRVAVATKEASVVDTVESWKIALPEGAQIIAVAKRPAHDPTASIGRTLGDRSVLFKYLNPNLVAVALVTGTGRLEVMLLDAVSGAVLHHAVHDDAMIDAQHTVHIVLSENWVVYTFAGRGTGVNPKGTVAVVLELFESAIEDMRVESETISAYDSLRPHVVSRAFTLPYGVDAAGVTSTRSGITTKKLLLAFPSGQVCGVTRRLMDARRPVEPPSDADKEEGLVPYDPVIPISPQWMLSYNQTVMGVRHILSFPSLMESTALVLAYGQDIFFTRDTPSGTFDMLSEDFSKGTLLLTIVGLSLGIMVAGPMVRRKKLNAHWK
ncbi:hypothetical protein THASP1DRAFT_29351 [Thamnocephalis sphaerospora]|uniref:ER membrane protein complex subunit 1 n=1 Tax=Thamnocephalis sphaerospora TaxID=78915 RepID=A0A4P9XRY3_9FUNG|nr:hypothetical protein THASP1DRAFT_29351 [Thamnocephalis sphaerospora]|eukprot:RKP08866.1 hypothetical protein THASP1DRAFT_29351 [Thamnocephalis sphaerospora]